MADNYTSRLPARPWTIAALSFVPFENSPIVNFNLFDITGLKPFTIIATAAVVSELLRERPWRFRDSTERIAILWYVAYLFAFFVVFARSIPHLPTYHAVWPDQFGTSGFSYFLSFFVRPALGTCLFALIIRQFQTEEDVDLVRRTIGISMAAFSVSVLAVILINGDIYSGGRDAMAATFDRYLGLHFNSVGTICMVTGPLLLYSALSGGVFAKVAATLVVLVVAAIESRSTLVVFWLELVVLVLIWRRGVWFFAMSVAATALVFVLARPTLTTKAPRGLAQEAFQLDPMLSGRLGFLWVPLLTEWIGDPGRLFWGVGRYGILLSKHFTTGGILPTAHAHNAFIDLFLDAGLVGVVVVVVALAAGFSYLWRIRRSIRDPMFWALVLGLCGFLAGTVSERGFFPQYDNLLVFPVLALLVNVARLRTTGLAAPASR